MGRERGRLARLRRAPRREAVVHIVGPTPRCVMTTLAQPGLPKDSAVLKTIARIGLKELAPSANSLVPVGMPRSSPRRGAPRDPVASSAFSPARAPSLPHRHATSTDARQFAALAAGPAEPVVMVNLLKFRGRRRAAMRATRRRSPHLHGRRASAARAGAGHRRRRKAHGGMRFWWSSIRRPRRSSTW